MVLTTEELIASLQHEEDTVKTMNFVQAISATQKQSNEYVRLLRGWTVADFCGEIDMFGTTSARGSLPVNLVLSGYAAHRTQLLGYLNSCGREEWHTVNLWAGLDSPDSCLAGRAWRKNSKHASSRRKKVRAPNHRGDHR